MAQLLRIAGFGLITEKQALAECQYFAKTMQAAYTCGNLKQAIAAMTAMKPFVDALRLAGYPIEKILP